MALVSALLLIAVLFVTLQAPMVGVLQVIVYAGAIMVLFLFVIMLLNPAALEQQRGLWWGFGTLLAADARRRLGAFGGDQRSSRRPGGGDGTIRQSRDAGKKLV